MFELSIEAQYEIELYRRALSSLSHEELLSLSQKMAKTLVLQQSVIKRLVRQCALSDSQFLSSRG